MHCCNSEQSSQSVTQPELSVTSVNLACKENLATFLLEGYLFSFTDVAPGTFTCRDDKELKDYALINWAGSVLHFLLLLGNLLLHLKCTYKLCQSLKPETSISLWKQFNLPALNEKFQFKRNKTVALSSITKIKEYCQKTVNILFI